MKKPSYAIKINNIPYPATVIEDFYIEAGVKWQFPRGILIFRDRDGFLFSQFRFPIGTIVNVFLQESDPTQSGASNSIPIATTEEPIPFVDLIVVGIKNAGEFSAETAAGKFALVLAHPWLLFKDYNNHAYAPMPGYELVKKVVKDPSRGYKIKLKEDNVAKTDDAGKYPRYKVNTSDDAFLMKNVLPTCSIGGGAAYMFIDEFGEFQLQSYKTMFSRTPKVAFVPPTPSFLGVGDDYKAKLSNEGVDIKAFLSYSSIKVSIGGQDITEQIKALSPHIYMEHNLTRRVIVGTSRSAAWATSQNKKSPIVSSLMKAIGNTDSRTFINRTVDEAVALNTNANGVLDEMFLVDIVVPSSGNLAPTGSTAHLLILPSEASGKKTHWLSGKWLVVENKHFAEGENLIAYTNVTLARPTFMFKKGSSTIENEEIFYEMGD